MIARLLGALRRKPVATPPEPFGYKIAWFAVKNATSQRVADALELKDRRPESWKKGIDFAHGLTGKLREWDRVFVTPPVSGWVLAVGWCAGLGHEEDNVLKLSSSFEEAQAFATHRVSEAHQWLLARNGTLLRAFSFAGDSDWIVKNWGDLTPIERELGFFDKPEDQWFVKEDHVIRVAGAWSIDPSTLDAASGPSELGIIGRTRIKMS